MLLGHMRTPAQIIGELLSGHPEAVSLQAEASHCRALVRSSAACASQAFDAAQAARLGYEELRHRLDPRCVRTIGFAVGLLTLILVGAGLTLLDAIELSVVLGPIRSCSGCYWPRCAASVIRTSCSALWSACSFSA